MRRRYTSFVEWTLGLICCHIAGEKGRKRKRSGKGRGPEFEALAPLELLGEFFIACFPLFDWANPNIQYDPVWICRWTRSHIYCKICFLICLAKLLSWSMICFIPSPIPIFNGVGTLGRRALRNHLVQFPLWPVRNGAQVIWQELTAKWALMCCLKYTLYGHALMNV